MTYLIELPNGNRFPTDRWDYEMKVRDRSHYHIIRLEVVEIIKPYPNR